MIHLDTNYVIDMVTAHSPLKPVIQGWLQAGETLAVSAVTWSEFLTGPVTQQQVRDASAILESRVVVFGVFEAATAARLYNQTGRKRGTRMDCFIAATAICARATLATNQPKGFPPLCRGRLATDLIALVLFFSLSPLTRPFKTLLYAFLH